VAVNEDDQPSIGRVTSTASGRLGPCQVTPLLVPAPRGPWRVEATVDPTFVPHELDSNLGDARALGAVVSFEFVPLSTD
jgi:hypothetical protein